MDVQSQSSRFRALFLSALQDYQTQTGTTLSTHPLAERLQHCDSVESVTAVLREQARAFSDFRGGEGRIMESLKTIVSVLHSLPENSALGEVTGLVRRKASYRCSMFVIPCSQPIPPARLISAGFAILLAVRSFLIFHVYILVTCKCVRRSRMSAPAMMLSSICSKR